MAGRQKKNKTPKHHKKKDQTNSKNQATVTNYSFTSKATQAKHFKLTLCQISARSSSDFFSSPLLRGGKSVSPHPAQPGNSHGWHQGRLERPSATPPWEEEECQGWPHDGGDTKSRVWSTRLVWRSAARMSFGEPSGATGLQYLEEPLEGRIRDGVDFENIFLLVIIPVFDQHHGVNEGVHGRQLGVCRRKVCVKLITTKHTAVAL